MSNYFLTNVSSENVGKIILESNDRILKAIAGALIAEILCKGEPETLEKWMKYFWPRNAPSYVLKFPAGCQTARWWRELFEFIDELEKRQDRGYVL